MRKRVWIILIAGLLLVAGGVLIYSRSSSPTQAQESEPEMATVTRGDIVLTADGSGELIPAAELGLTFRASGVVESVSVTAGDQVAAGDLLAQLEIDDLERAVAEAMLDLEIAQLDLAEVQDGPSELELTSAQLALQDAQIELAQAQDAYERTFNSNLDASAESRKVEYDWWVGYYQKQKEAFESGELSQADHDWAMAGMIAAEGRMDAAYNQALNEENQAANRLAQAQTGLDQAREDLALLESGPLTETLIQATLAADQALWAHQEAQANLAAARLTAPFGGTVMDVAVAAGDQVGENTIVVTLANMDQPQVLFWVEEMDMHAISVGNSVSVVFEAFPDDVFTGEIVRVSPLLVTVGNTPAVQAWARVDTAGHQVALLSGMNADVEITAAEARDALLVPLEALWETADGGYAVSVVRADGELETRPVVIGLQDYTYAEIVEGVALGEVVSVGEID